MQALLDQTRQTFCYFGTVHHSSWNQEVKFILSSDALSINKQHKEWNSLPTRRKKRNVVTISITFNYVLIIEVEKELNAAASADSLHSLAHGNC